MNFSHQSRIPMTAEDYDVWRSLLQPGMARCYPDFEPTRWNNPLNYAYGAMLFEGAKEWLPHHARTPLRECLRMPDARSCAEAFEIAARFPGPAISVKFAERLAREFGRIDPGWIDVARAAPDMFDPQAPDWVYAVGERGADSAPLQWIAEFLAVRGAWDGAARGGVDDPSKPTEWAGGPERMIGIRYVANQRAVVKRKGAEKTVASCSELRETSATVRAVPKNARTLVLRAPLDLAGARAPIDVYEVEGRVMRPVLAPDTLRPCNLESFEWAAQGRFEWRDDPFRPPVDRCLPVSRMADRIRRLRATPPKARIVDEGNGEEERLKHAVSKLLLIDGVVYREAGSIVSVEIETGNGVETRFACETAMPGDEDMEHDGIARKPVRLRLVG